VSGGRGVRFPLYDHARRRERAISSKHDKPDRRILGCVYVNTRTTVLRVRCALRSSHAGVSHIADPRLHWESVP